MTDGKPETEANLSDFLAQLVTKMNRKAGVAV